MDAHGRAFSSHWLEGETPTPLARRLRGTSEPAITVRVVYKDQGTALGIGFAPLGLDLEELNLLSNWAKTSSLTEF